MIGPILRKLRGAIGTALTWAVVWALGGFALFTTIFMLSSGLTAFWAGAIPVTIMAGISGFIGGTMFSLVLGTIHRRRRLEELSPLRMGLWGGLAGLIVPMALLWVAASVGIGLQLGALVSLIVACGGLGATTAGGTVKLAQWSQGELEAPSHDGLPGSGK
jgi:hypothetical protein